MEYKIIYEMTTEKSSSKYVTHTKYTIIRFWENGLQGLNCLCMTEDRNEMIPRKVANLVNSEGNKK